MTFGDPRVVGAGEEVDEAGVVHGEDRIEAVVGGLDDRRAGRDELVAQDVAALGLLVARQPHAEPVPAVGRVAAVPRRPDDRHRQRHPAILGTIPIWAGFVPTRHLGGNRVDRWNRSRPDAVALHSAVPPPPPRPRARDLGLTFGIARPGAHNAITDVPGVRVGHVTRWADGPDGIARTGVTAIVPDDLRALYERPMAAGPAVLNGCGELTGSISIAEWGTSRRRSC